MQIKEVSSLTQINTEQAENQVSASRDPAGYIPGCFTSKYPFQLRRFEDSMKSLHSLSPWQLLVSRGGAA